MKTSSNSDRLTVEEQQVLDMMRDQLNQITERSVVEYPLLSAAYRWQDALEKATRRWKPIHSN